MLPLGFLLFPYLVILISKISNNNSFLIYFISGFSFGLGFLIIYLSWIFNPFLVYEITKPYTIVALLLPVCLSIFFGLSFFLYKLFNKRFLIILVTPFVFLLIEFSITNFIYGFPWISNSLVLSNNLLGLKLLKYFGTFGSGYLIVSIFVMVSLFISNNKYSNFKNLFFINLSPFIFVFLIPFISIFYDNQSYTKEIKIDIHQILSPIKNINKKNIEKNIIKIINSSDADYIIFAENNFPYLIDKKKPLNLNKFINDNKKVIIGGTSFEEGKYYNSFLLLEKNKIHFFDKKILVPFGEFLPLRKYFNFMESISGSVDFQTGLIDRAIKTDDELIILPVICYEIIFDKIFKNINKKEVDIIINLTNDSWFGDKIGPYQHFYIARMKSLIANKPLLRVSNNGISAIVDNNGIILRYSEFNKRTNLNYKLNFKNNKSFYFFHNLFFYYLVFIFILFVIIRKKSFNENK